MIAAANQLAHLNAILNLTAGTLLVIGYVHIRAGRETAHRRAMMAAFLVSVLFLISYLLHHATVGSVKFTHPGVVRVVYLAILFSHIVLAAAVVPLAATTLLFGHLAAGRTWSGRPHGPNTDKQEDRPQDRTLQTARFRARHRSIARWTLPIWLYVSVTGVVVYAMLYHIFPPLGK